MNSRTFCLLMLLANIALFGWLFNQNLQPSPERPGKSPPAIPAGVPTLRLLSEMSSPLPKRELPGRTLSPAGDEAVVAAPPAESPAAPPVATETTNEASATAPETGAPAGTASAIPPPEAAAPAPPPTPPEAPPPAPACYTLGPFADEDQRTQARQSLGSRLQSAHERDEVSGPGRQWVYLGPYPSTTAAEKEMAALKTKGVEDIFVVKQGENKNTISLGLFKEKISVTERIKEMKSLGYEARVEARQEAPPRYWLDVAVDSAQVSPAVLQEVLPGSAQTKALDCAKIAGAAAAQ